MNTAAEGSSELPGLHAFLADPDPDPDPAGAAGAGAPLAEQLLYFDARSGASRFVAAGGVQFNRVLAYRVGVEDLEPMARRREAAGDLRLELVKFTFTVRELPPGSSYEAVRVRIALDPPRPLLLLRPPSRSAQPQRTKSFSQDVQPLLLKLMRLDLTGTATTSAGMTEPQPVMTALDLGPEGFGWTFQAQDGAPMPPGRRQTIAVIELAADTSEIGGVFDAEAIVTRRLLGLVGRSSAGPAQPPVPFTIQL